MAWQSEMVGILRVYIDDMDKPYRFTDSRLESVIAAGARLVLTDVSDGFDAEYTISMCGPSITPDPSDDKIFIDLSVLKAACLIDHAEARRAAKNSGFSVKEFSSSIDTKGLADARIKLLEIGMCKVYEDALFTFQSGQYSSGTAILSPFRTYYHSYLGR